MTTEKVICLVDGEHYLPVTKAAVNSINSIDHIEVVALVFIGGTEKLKLGDEDKYSDFLDAPVFFGEDREEIPYNLIEKVIKKYKTSVVMDLSDEPVLDYAKRFNIASVVLSCEATYQGADFKFEPLTQYDIMEKPSIKIFGTGKRIGKTAVSGFVSRLIDKNDYNPCVVAMGRGGPEEPEIVHGENIEISPEFLLEQSNKGVHAASDHWEDALMSRILTIGSRRCGGGLAGDVFITNMDKAAKKANKQDDAEFVIFEGSGAAIPPIKTNKGIVLVGANQPIENIKGYFGPFRIKLGDLVIITMCEEPMASEEKIKEIEEFINRINPNVDIIPTVFRPKPLGDISGKKVLFVTTAPDSVRDVLSNYLEETYDCKVVGLSSHLSNRPLLKEDIDKYKDDVDCIVTELKAAAVDVVTNEAIELGIELIYCDNIPVPTSENYPDLAESILKVVDSAISDFEFNIILD